MDRRLGLNRQSVFIGDNKVNIVLLRESSGSGFDFLHNVLIQKNNLEQLLVFCVCKNIQI